MAQTLVTGAAGFIGSHLTEALLDRGDAVIGLDALVTGRRVNLESVMGVEAFRFVEGDIRDGTLLRALCADVQTVYHQAAIPSVPRSVDDPVTTTDVNCVGTATVLDAARDADVETVVVASSSSVYGSETGVPKVETMTPQPESPYALSKHYTEQLAMHAHALYGIDTVALRYFNIFGPRQRPDGPYAAVIPAFLARMQAGEPPVIYGDGQQTRDFTYIDNAVQANLAAADADVGGEVLNIGAGERLSVRALVDLLNDVLGTSLTPEHSDPRVGDVKHSSADIDRAERLIGYMPVVDVTSGIRQLVDSVV